MKTNYRDFVNQIKDPKAFRALFHELARQIHVKDTVEEGISILNEKVKFLKWKEEFLPTWEAMPIQIDIPVTVSKEEKYSLANAISYYTPELEQCSDLENVSILEFEDGIFYIKEMGENTILARRIPFFTYYKLKNKKHETVLDHSDERK